MPRLSTLKDAAGRLSRTEFIARHGAPVLVPTRIVGGSVRRGSAGDRNSTMMHGPRDWQHTAIEVASAVTISPGSLVGDAPMGQELRIGRDWSADIKIADYTVSKDHALWRPGWSRSPPTVEDRGSRNGTWVGKKKLEQGKPQAVRSREEVRFGRMVLTYYVAAHLYDVLRAGG